MKPPETHWSPNHIDECVRTGGTKSTLASGDHNKVGKAKHRSPSTLLIKSNGVSPGPRSAKAKEQGSFALCAGDQTNKFLSRAVAFRDRCSTTVSFAELHPSAYGITILGTGSEELNLLQVTQGRQAIGRLRIMN